VEASAASGPHPASRSGIAERLWAASRLEFSARGYHGARVQGIARRAGCNVALLYRHWSSKKALYLDVLRSVWLSIAREMLALMEQGRGAPGVVSAYIDAHMHDPLGAQILVREFLDGGPFFSQLAAAEPSLIEPVRRAARALSEGEEGQVLRPGLDALLTALSVGALTALIASKPESAHHFSNGPISAEAWRRHLQDLLLHGVLACAPVDAPAAVARVSAISEG